VMVLFCATSRSDRSLSLMEYSNKVYDHRTQCAAKPLCPIGWGNSGL
jgi:hypothetical protein